MTGRTAAHRHRPTRHRALVLGVVLLVGPLLLTELGVRWLIAAGHLPPAPTHVDRLDLGLAVLHSRPPQDVLIMGDSQAATGIDPTALAGLLADATGRPTTVYGVGVPSSTLEATELLYRIIAADGRAPRVVVLALSLSSMVTPLPEIEGEGGSPSSGRRAPATLAGSPMGRWLTGCGDTTSLVDRLDCELARFSAAWRWRGRAERLASVLIGSIQGRLTSPGGVLRTDGVYARPPAPAEVIRRQAARPTVLDGRTFPVFEPSAATAVARLITAIEADGGTLILVVPPLTPPFREAILTHNPAWDADRRRTADALAAALGRELVFVDAYGAWWDDRSASDANHLSEDAAPHFTRQLWSMPTFRDSLVAALAPTAGPAEVEGG